MDKKEEVTVNPIEKLLDEDNSDVIVLQADDGTQIAFDQIAIIPMEDSNKIYAILMPLSPMQGVNEGEGVLFDVDREKGSLTVVNDLEVIDNVMKVYQKLVVEYNDEIKAEQAPKKNKK